MAGSLRRILKGVLAVLAVIVVVAVGGFAVWAHLQMRRVDVTASRSRWPPSMTFEAADRAALDLVSRMTLAEKVEQMTGSGIAPMTLALLLSGTMATVYAGANERLGIPPVAFTDGPRGVTVGRATSFPVAIARAATWDVDLQRRVGDAIGQEVRARGANYWGGPCLNLVRHPSMGRAQETFGEDPWLTGEMGVAILEAVQRHNVMACAKHFALNSMETARFKVDVQVDERTLQEVYLPHFRKAVDHDVATFMSAYNKVRGEWCGESRHLLTDVLREQWSFKGYVTSDWMWGLYDGRKGVHAGLDIEMPGGRFYGANLEALVERGEVPLAEVDESVRRIVRTKLQYLTRPDPQAYSDGLVASPEHVALAREVAEKAMVLLKNDGGVLPLDKAKVKRLAVVGHLADADNTGDHGSSKVVPPHVTSALKGLRDYLDPGATILHSEDPAEVGRIAKEADAVVVVAGAGWDEVGEYVSDDKGMKPSGPSQKRPLRVKLPLVHPIEISGGDYVPLALKPRDVAVVRAACAANPRCVVVLVGGSVYTMEEWRQGVPSILMAWYFGMEGGHALARVLFGDVNPSGRMPLTTPKDEAQLPPFDEYADTVEYGPYHGYTLLDRNGQEPAFAFGHGLSYTTFAFANLTVRAPRVAADGTVDVTVDVTNTGARAGEEVVQLYVGFEGSQVERPVKLLRAFDKVALAPGETKTVPLSVAVRDLAWYDVATRSWRVEPMTYGILVGPSSRRGDLLAASVTVGNASGGLEDESI
ncbi:MAG TPA: glycoside hydrolase family 3 C-terminal domain-containing protein [Vicinamibacteria bacterium]|nr:glycoside hydrolase family 3 C-terminal domain-containing protein [Vicinamibacteria bacterium]